MSKKWRNNKTNTSSSTTAYGPHLRLSGRTPLPKFLCCSSSFLRLWCREGGALEALTFLPVVLVWNHQSSQTFQGSHTLRIFTIDLKFLGCFLGFSHCLKQYILIAHAFKKEPWKWPIKLVYFHCSKYSNPPFKIQIWFKFADLGQMAKVEFRYTSCRSGNYATILFSISLHWPKCRKG